jgi:hypothetical protein
MRRFVEVYVNETPGSMLMAYMDGAAMRCTWAGQLELPADVDHQGVPMAALENVFRLFNDDGRQNTISYRDRSLSVADVVTFDRQESFSCETLGWVRLAGVITGQPVQGPEHATVPQFFSTETHPELADTIKAGIQAMANRAAMVADADRLADPDIQPKLPPDDR